ncbi:hypothetical protein CATMIT_02687 [Catenibacterium mitsuokai DSM 15897]|nr:hypothetical protein CATMIT_02687 [Catenibacterium mitsuokai DSM 15897]
MCPNEELVDSFRPQQGLTIMNYKYIPILMYQYFKKFPSPTGVNHYEFKEIYKLNEKATDLKFPSPTGVNHYE